MIVVIEIYAKTTQKNLRIKYVCLLSLKILRFKKLKKNDYSSDHLINRLEYGAENSYKQYLKSDKKLMGNNIAKMSKFPKQFYLINYDDLLKDTKSEVQKMFEFCQLDYSLQTDNFLKDSTALQSKDAYSVFKQKKDDLSWQGSLPKFIEAEIKADQDFIKLNKIFKWV